MWAGIPPPSMCSTASCGRDQECTWTDDLRKWPGKNYCGGNDWHQMTKLPSCLEKLFEIFISYITINLPVTFRREILLFCLLFVRTRYELNTLKTIGYVDVHVNIILSFWQASYSALRNFTLFFKPLNREDMACWLRVFMNQTSTERLPEGLNKFWVDDESPYHDIQSDNMSSPLSDVFPCEMAEEVICS